MHLLDCFDGVDPVFYRRRKLKFLAEFFLEAIVHTFPNPHRSIPLHIRMSAYWTGSRARPSNVSAEEKEIHHLLNGDDGVLVLRQSHRPAANDALAPHSDPRCFANLVTGQAAAFDDVVPRGRAQMLDEFLEANRIFLDKGVVEDGARLGLFLRQHLLHDPAHCGHIAVDTNRQPEITQRRASIEKHFRRKG